MSSAAGVPVVTPRGPLWARVLFVVMVVGAMAYLRLFYFPREVVPLAYALPLLVCLWTRDRVMLWVMTGAFLLMVATKGAMLSESLSPGREWTFLVMQTANTLIPAAVIHAVILLTARLERAVADLEQTNGELEASNEELAAREEEITRQNEELQSQAEELEQHAEELNTQTEELQVLNEQLAARERTLNDLLETSGHSATEQEILARIGEMVERLLGPRAVGAAVLEPAGDRAVVHALYGLSPLPDKMRRESTVSSLAVARDRAAFLPDMSLRPDLQAPELGSRRRSRSVLAAPLRAGEPAGASLEVYSDQPGDWSEQDLRMAQWLAEQCGRLWGNSKLRSDLDRQRDLLRTVTDSASAALVMADESGLCTYMNPAAERLAGCEASECEGRPLHDLFHSADGPDAHAIEHCPLHAPPGKAARAPRDDTFVKSNGERIPVICSATPVSRHGRFVATVLEVRDVRDQRRAETEREQLLESERAARAEAERASRAKDEFVATLSHELRTPLNAVLGWSALLGRGQENSPDDLAKGLQVIERNARHQAQLISDLLDISRITSGKIRLDVRPVDMPAVIDAALAAIGPAAEAKGLRIVRVVDPVDRIVMGDPDRLQQIVWNLLTNAIKFTPKGGSVRVVLSRVASYVQLTVADTGQGIAPEVLPHLFERYRQGDTSSTRRHGGLGLGLAIVKHLIELHGGSVYAKSDGVDKGATFSVLLPVVAVEAEGRAAASGGDAPAQPDGASRLAGIRVLIVDDEEDARDLVQRVLEDVGAEVLAAGSAEEALALLSTGQPHLLISDIGMPGTDGYSLIRRIRGEREMSSQTLPAIALTAFARPEDRMRALLAGFQSHVSKPVEPAELIATAASLAPSSRVSGDKKQ